RRSRNPPRRAHGTLQPPAESVIVGYYTSAEVHLPGLPVSAAQWARKERYGKRRRYRPYQREEYEIDRTEIEKCPAAQRARERLLRQPGYCPRTLPPERPFQEAG